MAMNIKKSLISVFLALGLCSTLRLSADPPVIDGWVSSQDLSRRLDAIEPPSFTPGAPDGRPEIEINEAIKYQTIVGLGASLEHTTCANLFRLDESARAEVMERLVSPENGIGMSTMRICMGTPDFTGEPWYTYNDMPPGKKDPELKNFSIEKDRAYILPVLKLALEKNPDLKFYASPWSPPGWMKTCDDMIGGHLYPRYYDAYARYFVKFIESYQAEGIPIYAVTVQNEPGVNKRDDTLGWWYPSCQWSLVVDEDTWWPVPTEIMGHPERDFIRDHLGPAFRKNNIATRIWCFDHNLNNLWYPRNILSDPAAAQYVEGTAFHPYAGKAADMGAFREEFPDKKVFLSEGSMFGVSGAMKIIDFLRNWASTYNAWVTVIDSEGKPNNGPFKASRTPVMIDAKTLAVTYGFEYYMYGQFMKFIRPGAVRIDSGASSAEFGHVAFKNEDGSVVVVAVNPGGQSRKFQVAHVGKVFSTSLPAQSVGTYRWAETDD